MQAQVLAKEQELLKMRTEGLPPETAELERIKYERDSLNREHQALRTQFAQQQQYLQETVGQYREKEAREIAINVFLHGVPGRMQGYSEYGLTRAELEKCSTPSEMEDLARGKAADWISSRKQDLEREKATIESERRKTTGAAKFDKGEPTSGGNTMPDAGTDEFEAYIKKVKNRQVTLR
jgi:hypothetical protein